MTDYTKLVKALRCKRDDCEGCDISFFDKDEGWMCQYAAKDDDAAAAIEDLQAQLPKRGKWKETDMGWDGDTAWVCSVCGEPWTLIDGTPKENNMNFCPNCGSRMRGEVNERG